MVCQRLPLLEAIEARVGSMHLAVEESLAAIQSPFAGRLDCNVRSWHWRALAGHWWDNGGKWRDIGRSIAP